MQDVAAAFYHIFYRRIDMLRTQVREEIFKIVFRIPFNNRDEMEQQIEFSMEELDLKSKENQTYIRNKATAILEQLDKIDEQISNYCEGWNLNRIGKAEIAIMRIAVYEMLFEEDIPNKVAINEAVELGKQYCDEEAKGFINAVLGKIERSIG